MEAPLVLLHGFCESPQIFRGLVDALPLGQKVICPLLPGHGGSAWNSQVHNLDDLAVWLRETLAAAGVEDCVLIGHSLGGYIAAAFAARFPQHLRGLGLLHATALPDTPQRQASRNKALAFLEQYGTAPFLKAFVQSLFHAPQAAWTEELGAITAQTDPAAIHALVRIMRDRPDRTAALAALEVPVMYIIGDHDQLVDPGRSKLEMDKVALALLHRIPEASHMGMYETPGEVRAAVENLLRATR